MTEHRAPRHPLLTRRRRAAMLMFCLVASILLAIVIPLADSAVVRYLLACLLLITATAQGLILGEDIHED